MFRNPPTCRLDLTLLALALALFVVCEPGPAAPTPDAIAQKIESLRAGEHLRPKDDPEAAYRHAVAKRAPIDGDWASVPDRYRAAVDHSLAMPRWSSRLGRFVQPPDSPPADDKAAELGTWTPIGPGNIGGRTRAFLIHPNDPNRMWAAGVSGGVLVTTNAGASWRPSNRGLSNLAVNSMAMDPSNPNVLYAGTGEGYYREVVRGTGLPLRGGGIFKSTNGGSSWSFLRDTRGANFHWVNDLVVSPADPRRVYAATRSGLWRSDNAGNSWQRILAPGVQGGCLSLSLRPGGAAGSGGADDLVVACGTFQRASVYRSRAAQSAPGAAGFQAVLSEAGMGRTSVAHAPSNPDVVYALAASIAPGNYDGGLHAVFRSTDGGDSWQARVRNTDPVKLNTLLLTNPVIANLVACGFDDADDYSTLGWYANIIAVDPTDADVVYAGGVDLFRSDDGGASWGTTSYWWIDGSAHADQHRVVFDPRYGIGGNSRMFVAGDGGIYRTDNPRAAKATGLGVCNPNASAVRWTSLARGYRVTQFYHGAVSPDGGTAFGGTQDNGTLRLDTSLNGGGSPIDAWQEVHGGDGAYVAIDPDAPSTVYAESQFFGFVKSTDGGQSFDAARSGITDPPDSFAFITPFVLDPNDPRRLWTGGPRMWRTDNAAGRWQAASAGLPDGTVSAVAVAFGDPDRVWAGTDDGWIHRQTSARSAGGNTDWPRVRPRTGFVSWLAADPSNPNSVYATYSGFGGRHVWHSGDGGVTWTSLDGGGADGLPDIPVHALVVDPVDPLTLYLATDLGIYVTNDGGGSWAVENSGFFGTVTESLTLLQRPNRTDLFAFTHGTGAWRVQVTRSADDFLSLAEPSLSVAEGAGQVELVVERSAETAGGAASVSWSVQTGDTATSATPGRDLDATTFSGTLQWPAGDTAPKTITVGLLDDADLDPDESFQVRLSNPQGAELGGQATATVTLVDDEEVPTSCTADERTVCLLDGRFLVRGYWRTDLNETGDARVVSGLASNNSALLWFFGADNWEVLLKVLDGCAINQQRWVFLAATTNQEFGLTFVDTATGEFERYRNQLGAPAPAVTDTSAFECP